MSLFRADPADSPLADRMRPRSFDEIVGQEHMTAPGAPFRLMAEAGTLTSAILWGPPGVGKTTIARLLAGVAHHRFVPFSAVLSGIKEVKGVMEEAEQARRLHGRRTLLFVDEIHRFNKAQQDAFLPRVESGDVVLVGATTENPSFEVTAQLLSRMRVFVLKPITVEALVRLLERALREPDRGLGALRLQVEEGLLESLAALADGDARRALSALEAVQLATTPLPDGSRHATRADAARILEKHLAHDAHGDGHYDTVSAFIKSVRNSDPDAAVYWLARLLEAGEDPLFVARRIVILAAEDIGIADPGALPLAVAAFDASHRVGMPEARIILSEAAVYLALAAKSNSTYMAYEAARADLRRGPNEPVPLHLRNAATGLARALGHGEGYRYAHDDPGAARMPCLPAGLAHRRYYQPRSAGAEAELVSQWRRREGAVPAQAKEAAPGAPDPEPGSDDTRPAGPSPRGPVS